MTKKEKWRYVKVDVELTRHPKFVTLSDRTKMAWLEALCYCGQYLTDGVLPEGIVAAREASLLVKAGLFEPTDDGYFIHDYPDYQSTKAEIQGGRAKDAARKRAARRQGQEVDVHLDVRPDTDRTEGGSPRQSPPDIQGESVTKNIELEQELEPKTKIEDLGAEAPSNGRANITAASVLLAPDSRAMYFVTKLGERDSLWEAITPAALMKLAKDYDPAVIIEALSYVWEQPPSAQAPYPYLSTICRSIADRGEPV